MDKQPTKRFSDRVDNYIKYRPAYPPQVIAYLANEACLSATSVVADIGSGTGIFTKQLLDAGYKVFAVEPNEPMRAAANEFLGGYPDYISVNGGAEQTTLMDNSIDIITCAQAFHWFNTPAAKSEFKRILKPNGYAALIWNNRRVDADNFAIAYDQLLKAESNDYAEVNHQNLNKADFESLYRDGDYTLTTYPNVQLFDEAGLTGRAFSSSYVPAQNTAAGDAFLEKLKVVFNQYQQNGYVKFQYQTEIYLGRL